MPYMSTTQTLLLGAIAGFTIYLGLPMARVRKLPPQVGSALNALATGILIFLFWDVLSHGVEPVETHLQAHSWGAFVGYASLLVVGFAAGMMCLVYYDGWLKNKRATPLVGPGAAAVDEFRARSWIESLTPGRRLALLIATGIGLHNFGEGLAIGQSAAAGELSLALVLIIGFGLHNATEGFGIVGPLGDVKPSWRWIGLAGLIGGGPTFLGSLVGYTVTSHPLELAFYAAAGGAILYVIGEVWNGMRRYGHRELGLLMLSAGFLVGVLTDLIVTYGGA
jgi:zinc transporter, ZIP family